MAKIYVGDLATMLAERLEIDRRTAQRFVTSVVAVVKSGLEEERVVKVKGLGTFKIIDVESRESVSVNTGERLVINGHSKLTFVPDAALKELVNRPFSQFETVVLNDGVDFKDMEEDEAPVNIEEQKESIAPEEQETSELPPTQEIPEVLKVMEVSEASETSEVSEVQEVPNEFAEVMEEGAEVKDETLEVADEALEVTESSELPESTIVEAPRSPRRWLLWTIIALLVLAVGGVAGYFIGRGSQQTATNDTLSTEQTAPVPTVQQTPEQENDIQEITPDEQPQTAVADNRPEWEVLNDKDPRTRSGFYYIMGLDRMETVREGDNSRRIARRVFGAVELACYIEVYNGIDASTQLQPGTEIKIPKIEPKKAVKRRLQQEQQEQ